MMRNGITLNQGELVLIPVPFTDLSSQKRRPVILISNTNYNRISRDVLVVAVTSNLTALPHSLLLANEDLSSGTLNRPSMIRADKIYALEKTLIVKSFGIVKPEVVERICSEIQAILDRSQ
jgi:mRNA interferase MazF